MLCDFAHSNRRRHQHSVSNPTYRSSGTPISRIATICPTTDHVSAAYSAGCAAAGSYPRAPAPSTHPSRLPAPPPDRAASAPRSSSGPPHPRSLADTTDPPPPPAALLENAPRLLVTHRDPALLPIIAPLHRPPSRPANAAVRRDVTDSASVTPACFSRPSVRCVEGVPARKNAIVSPSRSFRADDSADSFVAPATSHGLPMNTHAPGTAAIFPSPSHGLAGAFRRPVRANSSSRVRLMTVRFKYGRDLSAAACSTPCIPPRSIACSASAVAAPPLDPVCLIAASPARSAPATPSQCLTCFRRRM